MPSSHQRRMPRFKSASKAPSFLFTFPKSYALISCDTLWYELVAALGDELFPDLLRFLTLWSRFDHALLRFITLWCDYDALNQALIRLSSSAVHCYAPLSSVTHWKISRSPISCRFRSRAYIKMQQISWVSSFLFLVVFQVQDIWKQCNEWHTQVAALFIGMETERGYRRRAWESVREREEACQA